MQSPFSTLFLEIQKRLQDQVPSLRWVDEDRGQLEEERPPVSYPCALIDFNDFSFEDWAEAIQMADGIVTIRLGAMANSNTSNITPGLWREKGLSFYDIEWAIYKALHGWKPEKHGYLMRVSSSREDRDDNIRVRVIRYSCTFEDYSASTEYESTTIPPPEFIAPPEDDIEDGDVILFPNP